MLSLPGALCRVSTFVFLRHSSQTLKGTALGHGAVQPRIPAWAVAPCAQAFSFLDAVRAAASQPGPWSGRGAVLAALGWGAARCATTGAGSVKGSPSLGGISWLPPGCNAPYVDGRRPQGSFGSTTDTYGDRPRTPHPHALHFMGMTPTAGYRAWASVARSTKIVLRPD